MTYLTEARELEALLGVVGEASRRKEVASLHPSYQAWIEKSPFAVLATAGPDGLDTSPRGDPAPLVRVVDERTLLLPERRGNNRVDSLRNILGDPRVSLIFLVPGVRETLRVNGRARLNVEPGLLASFAMQGQAPKCVIEITIDAVFFQCARALMRSSLWSPQQIEARPAVPTAGEMLDALTAGDIDSATYDRDLKTRQAGTLY